MEFPFFIIIMQIFVSCMFISFQRTLFSFHSTCSGCIQVIDSITVPCRVTRGGASAVAVVFDMIISRAQVLAM